MLPSSDAGPEALYTRSVLLAELELASTNCRRSSATCLSAHELAGAVQGDGRETGVSVNTLLSRKR